MNFGFQFDDNNNSFIVKSVSDNDSFIFNLLIRFAELNSNSLLINDQFIKTALQDDKKFHVIEHISPQQISFNHEKIIGIIKNLHENKNSIIKTVDVVHVEDFIQTISNNIDSIKNRFSKTH